MVDTIRNPIEWTADQLRGGSHHIEEVTEGIGGTEKEVRLLSKIHINRITTSDLRDVLRAGIEDLGACRTDVAFLCIIYPVVGIIITLLAFNQNLLPLVFPAMAGFALVGPIAAVGLYELSRRREMGQEVNWADAFSVILAPSFGAIVVLGLLLIAVFVVWMLTAQWIYNATLGPEPPASVAAFASDVLTTGAGWTMIVVGFAVGFVFAAAVLAMSVISFPLLLEHEVGVPRAIITSVQVTAANLVPIATWGLIVAAALALGSIPLFLGLIVVMPILGHATWHLYRKTVSFDMEEPEGK